MDEDKKPEDKKFEWTFEDSLRADQGYSGAGGRNSHSPSRAEDEAREAYEARRDRKDYD